MAASYQEAVEAHGLAALPAAAWLQISENGNDVCRLPVGIGEECRHDGRGARQGLYRAASKNQAALQPGWPCLLGDQMPSCPRVS